MPRRQARARAVKGYRPIYSPKDPPGRSVLWTHTAKQISQAAQDRTGQNESTITEHLMRLYGGQLSREEFGPLPSETDADAAA